MIQGEAQTQVVLGKPREADGRQRQARPTDAWMELRLCLDGEVGGLMTSPHKCTLCNVKLSSPDELEHFHLVSLSP